MAELTLFVCGRSCSACGTRAPLGRCAWPGCVSVFCRQCGKAFDPERLSRLAGVTVEATPGERFAYICPPHARSVRELGKAQR